jgi:hypothetical protein
MTRERRRAGLLGEGEDGVDGTAMAVVWSVSSNGLAAFDNEVTVRLMMRPHSDPDTALLITYHTLHAKPQRSSKR